jgi:anti-sigma B factor antagonist
VSDDPDVSPISAEACPRASASGRPAPDWLVVALPSEIDISNAEEVLGDLLAAIDCGSPIVVADMSMTAFCDVSGVYALLAAGRHALEAGVQLRVVARSEPVLRMFGLTGLDEAVPVYPTKEAAQPSPEN